MGDALIANYDKYSVLGIELWRGVGSDDLLDPNYKYSKKKDRSA